MLPGCSRTPSNAVVSTISALAADGAADRWAMTLVLLAMVVCDAVTALALSPASTIPAAQAADLRALMRRACVSPLAAGVGPGSTLLVPSPARPVPEGRRR